MDLTKWVQVKERKKFIVVYIKDLPEVMLPGGKTFGPVREGTTMLNIDIPEIIYDTLALRGYIRKL